MSNPESPNTAHAENPETLPGEAAASKHEKPCPECGEMVRIGLVRCWNCGAFQRPEMAEKYAKMQQNPAPIVLSELPEGEAIAIGDVDDDDDFELAVIPSPSSAPAAQKAEQNEQSEKEESDPGSEKAEKQDRQEEAGSEATQPHSVATGGDVLLEVAISEERELRRRRKQRGVSLRGGARTPGGFVIYCPYGCRIEVKDQHRGMQGHCPKCRAPFIVPVHPPDYGFREREQAEAAATAETSPSGKWTPWLLDQHLHTVSPEKLKLKPGSLAKDFALWDVAFGPEGMLLINLAEKKGGGLFGGGGDKKKAEAREAAQAHLRDEKPLQEVPAAETQKFSLEEMTQMRVAQPAANPAESMFAGVPVFGEKMIAVQLPFVEGQPPRFLSFALSGFREFREAAMRVQPNVQLSATGVPIEDEYVEYTCHYTDVKIQALQNVEWYQADPKFEVTLAGWKCAACGLTISEDARKKEGLGGKAGKGIAKAKCPKCTNKFGDQPLHTLPEKLASASLSEETAAATSSAS